MKLLTAAATNGARKHGRADKHSACQVLIVHGEDDRLVPLRNSKRLTALIPHSRLVILPECGHSPQEEMPHRLVSSVQEFLAA